MPVPYKYMYLYQDRVVKNRIDNGLNELFASGDFDMRIAATGQLIGVHRLVLMMFSITMREQLSKTPCANLVVCSEYFRRFLPISSWLPSMCDELLRSWTANWTIFLVFLFFLHFLHFCYNFCSFFGRRCSESTKFIVDALPRHMNQIVELFYLGRTIIEHGDRDRFEAILKLWRINGVFRKVLAGPKAEPQENGDMQRNPAASSVPEPLGWNSVHVTAPAAGIGGTTNGAPANGQPNGGGNGGLANGPNSRTRVIGLFNNPKTVVYKVPAADGGQKKESKGGLAGAGNGTEPAAQQTAMQWNGAQHGVAGQRVVGVGSAGPLVHTIDDEMMPAANGGNIGQHGNGNGDANGSRSSLGMNEHGADTIISADSTVADSDVNMSHSIAP